MGAKVTKAQARQFTQEDDALLAELGVALAAPVDAAHTPRQARIIAGFEDIQRFVRQHGHAPRHDAAGGDIFERLYAVRLERLRAQPECVALLTPLDAQGLLEAGAQPALDDDALLAELGMDAAGEAGKGADDVTGEDVRDDITHLRHVRPIAQIRAAEEVANREPCPDFESFKSLFAQVQAELQGGLRLTRRFAQNARISQGDFFIVDGQMAYVAEVGPPIKAPNGENDARLRVIYANGTQSNLLMRSLQRALNKDKLGRRVLSADGQASLDWDDDDVQSGTIYVLRSLSDHPFVAQHRALVHKIGVTGGDVHARITGAAHDATYLLADVEIVATYQLANIRRTRLENLLHRLFAPAQIELTLQDRFGHAVKPREWFLVPLAVIDQAVRAIEDGSVTRLRYDPASAALLPVD